MVVKTVGGHKAFGFGPFRTAIEAPKRKFAADAAAAKPHPPPRNRVTCGAGGFGRSFTERS